MKTKMGTLVDVKNNLKESKLGQIVGTAFGLLLNMVNSKEEVEQTVEEAVKETIKINPETAKEVNNFMEINKISEKVLEEKVQKQFNDTQTYKQIPNDSIQATKVSNISASEVKEKNIKEKEAFDRGERTE